jgi:hypothetical protein
MFLLVAIITFLPAAAQKVVTSSVPFLRVSPDVRASGMGDAGIATSPDAYAAYRNLAKTAFATAPAAIAASYTPWLGNVSDGVYLAAITGYAKKGDDQAFAASLRYFNMGTAQFASDAGIRSGSYTPRDFAVDAGYTRKLSATLAMGVALRYIHSSIASGMINGEDYKAGNAFSADASFYYNGMNAQGAGFTAGLTLTNLGGKISYTNQANAGGLLPANLGIGGAYHITDEAYSLMFTAEINKLLVPVAPDATSGVADTWVKSFSDGGMKALQYSAGAEGGWNNTVFIRAGILADGTSRMAGDNSMHLTLGAGLHYDAFRFDLSYLASAQAYGAGGLPAANTLRLGIAYSLAAKK